MLNPPRATLIPGRAEPDPTVYAEITPRTAFAVKLPECKARTSMFRAPSS